MAITSNQLDLIKLYMASFNRPPEKGGLDYWSGQLAGGKSLTQVVTTVFSLGIVKEIYPDNLPNDAFLTLIYINIFNKIPDEEGLSYWMGQLGGGKQRSTLVMDMINAGLSTADGTPGKLFIANRLMVSQHAVEQQLAKNTEISIATLKKILAEVSDAPASWQLMPTMPVGWGRRGVDYRLQRRPTTSIRRKKPPAWWWWSTSLAPMRWRATVSKS